MRFRGLALRLVLAASLSTSMLALSSRTASAGHTIAGGDCWKSGTPLWCLDVWRQGQFFHAILLDLFSDQRPQWRALADAARVKWTGAPGPQILTWTDNPPPQDVIDLFDTAQGQNGTGPGILAATWNCTIDGFCSNQNVAMRVGFSEIYFNRTAMDSTTDAKRQNTFAHEMGHALGLFHHTDPNRLMNPAATNLQGPTNPGDIGRNPPCSVANEGGIRCVYNWATTP